MRYNSLEDFLKSDERNAEIRYKSMTSYVRKSQRMFADTIYTKVFDRAATKNEKRSDNIEKKLLYYRTGLYKEMDDFFVRILRKYEYQVLYVENVHNEFLPEVLLRYGYQKVLIHEQFEGLCPPSFFKILC